jgi:hypothetical protein
MECVPEDDILHSHRHENLKSYIVGYSVCFQCNNKQKEMLPFFPGLCNNQSHVSGYLIYSNVTRFLATSRMEEQTIQILYMTFVTFTYRFINNPFITIK